MARAMLLPADGQSDELLVIDAGETVKFRAMDDFEIAKAKIPELIAFLTAITGNGNSDGSGAT